MADVRITCITKPHPLSAHEHITHVGNPAAGWVWEREQVIASIEAKRTPSSSSIQETVNGQKLGSFDKPAKRHISGRTPTGIGTTICFHWTSVPKLSSSECGASSPRNI